MTRQETETKTVQTFKDAAAGLPGNPTARQRAEAESGAAFGAAARSGARRKDDPTAPRAAGCNPSARAVEEKRAGEAFHAAKLSGTIRRNNPGAPKYAGCGYTPAEIENARAGTAFKKASAKTIAKPSGKHGMLA